MTTVDVLAIAAYRDDVELTCGGTLLKAAAQGQRTAIVDLTQCVMGSRGSAALRAAEASQAAEILGVAARVNLGLPDAGIITTPETRAKLVRLIRQYQPRVVLARRAYASQFDGVTQAGEAFPNGEPLYDIVRHQAAHYGSLIRVRYGEPFYTAETMRVDDLMSLNVSTF